MQPTRFRPHASCESTTNRDWSTTVGVYILLALIFALFATFAIYGKRHERPAPLLIELMDMNQSQADRKRECGQFRAIVDTLPGGTRVEVKTFDANCVTRFNGSPLESSELTAAEDFIIGAIADNPHTAPAVALKQILPDVEKAVSEGREIYIVINTDGDDINPDATLKQVEALSHIAHVKAFWITNVAMVFNQRNIVEKSYLPLGKRLIISGPTDQKAGWEHFQSLLIQ